MRSPTAKGVTKFEACRKALSTWETLGRHDMVVSAIKELEQALPSARWRIIFSPMSPVYTAKNTGTLFALKDFMFDNNGTNIEANGWIMQRDGDGLIPLKEVRFSWRGLTSFGTLHGDLKTLAKSIASLDEAKVTNLPNFPGEFDLLWVGRCSAVTVSANINTEKVDNDVVEQYDNGGGF